MTTETTASVFETLDVMVRMTNSNLVSREICDKWLLITYDMPNTPEGIHARAEFLKAGKRIGATQHTESVYMMPWSPEAEVLALQLAKAGKAYVWTSQITEESKSREITERYDKGLLPQLEDLGERINKIGEHMNGDRFGIANKMMDKTEDMFQYLESAIVRRGSAGMLVTLNIMKNRYNALFGKI